MHLVKQPQWTTDIKEAARIQESLAPLVDVRRIEREYEKIAAADIAYSKKDNSVFASVVIMKYPELVPLEKTRAQAPATFPYVPGFLFFREGPVLVKALERLSTIPDVIIFDANGVAHPKRIGMASHLGVLLDLPTIGCARKKLVGQHPPLPDDQGAHVRWEVGAEQIGYVVRTRKGVKPLYLSPGHLIDKEVALEIVLSATRGYRLPEPLRIAHIIVNKMRRNYDGRTETRPEPPR